MTEKKCTACGEDLSERELLQEINRKMDVADAKIDALKLHAAKHGAMAGAAAGAVSGGVVAGFIGLIRAKLGI